jgi:CRISP-associated protein Cas1
MILWNHTGHLWIIMFIKYIRKIKDKLIIDKEDKLRLLEVLTTDVMINKKMRPLMVALSQTTASLARCFAQETRRVQYPEFP